MMSKEDWETSTGMPRRKCQRDCGTTFEVFRVKLPKAKLAYKIN